jgi:O-antigen ligase
MNISELSVNKFIFILTIVFTLCLPNTNVANSIAYLILFTWIYKLSKGEIHFQKNWLVYCVLFFIFSFFISYFASWNSHASLIQTESHIFKSLLLLIAPLILFIIMGTIDFNTNQIQIIVTSFTLIMFTGILYSLFLYMHSPFSFLNRFSIFNFHPNRAGELISMVCIVLFVSLGFEKKTFKNIINILLLLISLLALLLTYSRGAWLGLFFSIVWLSICGFSNKKIRIVTIILLICLTFTFVCVPTFHSRFQSIFSEADNNGRIVLWNASFTMFHNLPWISLGPNKFVGIGPKMFATHFNQLVPNNHESDPMAHNNFLQMAVELGLIGLIIYSLMIVLIFIKAFSLKKNANGVYLKLLLIFIGWFISWNIHGLVDCPFKYSTVTYILMLLLGLLISCEKNHSTKNLINKLN